MRGSIRQRGKGSWEICVDVGRDPSTGKRVRQFETVRGPKRDAERRLRELLVSVEQGSYIKPARVALGEWLENWLQSYVATNCAPTTAESYGFIVYRYLIPGLGTIPLSQLQPAHIQRFYGEALSQGGVGGRGLSARTVLYCHRVLFEALRYGVKQGMVSRNVAEAADPPQPKHTQQATLAADDIAPFFEAAKRTPWHVPFYTKLYTGLRRSELLGLRWCDVDLDLAVCSVVQTLHRLAGGKYIMKPPKSAKSRRLVDLPPTLALLLREYKAEQQALRILLGKPLADSDLVFAHPDGTPLDPDTITHAFGKLIRRAGLPHMRLHDLRHTHATLMLKAGVHPKIVQERLGHANIGITLDLYSHVVPELQEAAAERFDKILETHLNGKMSARVSRLEVGDTGFEPVTFCV